MIKKTPLLIALAAILMALALAPAASGPSGTTSTTFGVIRTATAMRSMQLGVRLRF